MCFSLDGSKHLNTCNPHNLRAFLPAYVGLSSPCLFPSELSICHRGLSGVLPEAGLRRRRSSGPSLGEGGRRPARCLALCPLRTGRPLWSALWIGQKETKVRTLCEFNSFFYRYISTIMNVYTNIYFRWIFCHPFTIHSIV